MLPLLTLLSTTLAADPTGHREIDVELGFLPAFEGSGARLGIDGAVPTFGVRAAWPILPWLAVVGSYQHGASSAELYAGGDDVYDEAYGGGDSIYAYWWGNAGTVGARAAWEPKRWFGAYGTVQGVLLHNLVQLDDDLEDLENLTQLRAGGVTGGVLGTAGVEFRVHLGRGSSTSLGFYSEVGYTWLAPGAVGDFGTLQFAGLTGRVGTGVRF